MPGLPLELVNFIAKYSYLIFIFVMLQGSLLVIVIYLFAEKFASTHNAQLKQQLIKEESYKKALQILEEAKVSSVKLVDDANKKAQQLLADVQLLTNDVQQDLHNHLNDLSNKHINSLADTTNLFIDDYKKALNSETLQTRTSLEQTTTIVQEALLKEVDQFKEVLRSETIKTEEAVQLKIKDEYNAVREEIDQYKKDKIASIDNKIYDILSEVLLNSSSQVLDLDSHQDIVLKFLDDAKKEHRI